MRLDEQKHLNDLKERMLIEQAEITARCDQDKRDL